MGKQWTQFGGMISAAIPEPFKRDDKPGAPYYIRFQCKGRVRLWSTKTDDKELARKRGKDYRDKVVAGAFNLVAPMKAGGPGGVTFEDLFLAYMELPTPPERTRTANVQAFRSLLKTVAMSAKDGLTRLDAQMAVLFKKRCLSARPGDPSAVVTANTKLRKARSLFSREAMTSYSIEIPREAVRSFCEVALFKQPERLIEIPTPEVDAKAHESLKADPEAYRCFIAARYSGMRAGEIIAARRSWLNGNKLYIGGQADGKVTKSRRWRCVELDPAVVKILTNHDDPVGLCGPDVKQTVRRRLPKMLKDLGFPGDKPLHACRALCISDVYNTQGPRLARDLAGHSTQAVTDAHYARSYDLAKPVAFAG